MNNEIKKFFALITAFILFSSSAGAVIKLIVYVSSAIDGRIPYTEMPSSIENTPALFFVVWENTGSVGCSFRLRADVYEVVDGKLRQVHISWSREEAIEPGGVGNLKAYWYPTESGEYSVKTFIYFCNLIYEGPSTNFTVLMSNKTQKKIGVIKAESTEEYVDLVINPVEDLSSIIIIPRDYPNGWVFESLQSSNIVSGRDNRVKVNYVPQIWKEENVSFDVVSSDGRFYQTIETRLKKRETQPIYELTIMVLVLIILILSVRLIKYRRWGAKDDKGKESSG